MSTKTWFAIILNSICIVAAAQAPTSSSAPPAAQPPQAKVYVSKIQMQAGAATFKKYPGVERTVHYGQGFIEPFGLAEYYCGQGFPQQKEFPVPAYAKALNAAWGAFADMSFCIYRMPDGDIYAYDNAVGLVLETPDGSRMQTGDLIVGGTGRYTGATGMWLGLTEGRGEPIEVSPTRKNAPVMMRFMEGFVKLPSASN